MQVAGGSGDVASLRTRLEKRTPISVEAVEKSEKMDHAEIAAKIHRGHQEDHSRDALSASLLQCQKKLSPSRKDIQRQQQV